MPIETWEGMQPITVTRRDRLGGLLREYERAAWTLGEPGPRDDWQARLSRQGRSSSRATARFAFQA